MIALTAAQRGELLAMVEHWWSRPSTFETTGVHHGYRQVTFAAGGQLTISRLAWLLEPYLPVWDAWLSWIDPGGYIVPHVDAGPHRERWQVPISPAGAPYTVEHWRPHEVRNSTDSPRVVLVIDRDVIVQPVPSRFRLADVPAVLLR